MTGRTYVDVHVLQTVPPSNLNRDDAGSPKQAIYGGARRARVSSQAWKRATRTAFADHTAKPDQATRTKRISSMLADRLVERSGVSAEAATRISTQLLVPLGIKPGKKAGETAYLLLFGRPQADAIVDKVVERAPALADLGDDDLKDAVKDVSVEKLLSTDHPIDVALFGRMVADIPKLNVEAATQVAHAISTHAVETEFDYYTAVDDEKDKEKDDTGAGMIGTVEFTSATLYRFATAGLHQLADNLGGDVDATVGALEAFITGFVRSMPTGHQNSFAHHTLPSLVSVVIRDDQPVNLVSAFESPVRAPAVSASTRPSAGIAEQSLLRLAEEFQRCGDLWGLPAGAVWSTYSAPGDDARAAVIRTALGEPMPLDDVVAAAARGARQRLGGDSTA